MKSSYFRNKRWQQRWSLGRLCFIPRLFIENSFFNCCWGNRAKQYALVKCLHRSAILNRINICLHQLCDDLIFFKTFSPVALFAITSNFYLFVYLWEISMRSQSAFTGAAIYRVHVPHFICKHVWSLQIATHSDTHVLNWWKKRKREPLEKTIFKFHTARLPNN